MSDAALVRRLRTMLAADMVLGDESVMAPYQVEPTGRFTGSASAVLRPTSSDELVACLRAVHELGVAIVPRGGGTGLVGGAVAHEGEVVVSVAGVRSPVSVDPVTATLRASAGVTLAEADAAAAEVDLMVGVDLASRESATLGGMVATNAAGTRMMRYGAMRHQIIDVGALTSAGAAVPSRGLLKDNVGPSLGALLCGSEGTLAVVSDVTLRLWPRPARRLTALVGIDDVPGHPAEDRLMDLVAAARRLLSDLESIEILSHACWSIVAEDEGVASVLPGHRWYLLLESAGWGSAVGEGMAELVAAHDSVAVAETEAARRGLWALRERIPDAVRRRGEVVKLDISLAPGAEADGLRVLPAKVAEAAPEASTWLFGHAGDGNIHVNVTGAGGSAEAVTDAVLGWVCDHGGSISAEHGIGVAKRSWLNRARTSVELDLLDGIRSVWDPAGLMNPSVLRP